MRKVIVTMFMVVISASIVLTGCTKKAEEPKKEVLKVGMVTDSGSIDDKSFNQGSWEGILDAEKEFGIEVKYLQPVAKNTADYFKEIQNLYDAGFKFIITPGFMFETAIFMAQEKYPDAKFVLIDGTPHNEDYSVFKLGSNVVSAVFAEHESGFLAGVAASLQLKEGEFGFIGGQEIPAVQKFNWGFQQGIIYANENKGTSITIKPENIIYQGTFNDVAAGGVLGAAMYDKGVDAIFIAAGSVGQGTINEAVNRVKTGEKVWAIGVDRDQYSEGAYGDGQSVILTSAIKKLTASSYDMIKAELNGTFPGGESLVFSIANDSVGLAATNPNLDASVEAEVAEIIEMIKKGSLIVSSEQGNLVK